jgi:carbon storage regulator
MLRITRRAGERVIIGDDIVLTVLEVSGQTVRLGIDAPRSLPIFREEIWVAVKRENEAAAKAAPDLALPGVAGSVSSVVPGSVSGS